MYFVDQDINDMEQIQFYMRCSYTSSILMQNQR
uniref:Uncharacterized protein n=1 Tax=Arundo donax TaxID=35708 RepID=A0A0A8YLX4_ARUDO